MPRHVEFSSRISSSSVTMTDTSTDPHPDPGPFLCSASARACSQSLSNVAEASWTLSPRPTASSRTRTSTDTSTGAEDEDDDEEDALDFSASPRRKEGLSASQVSADGPRLIHGFHRGVAVAMVVATPRRAAPHREDAGARSPARIRVSWFERISSHKRLNGAMEPPAT